MVAKHGVQVVAGYEYGFETIIVVVLRFAHKLNRFVIPINTKKSAFGVFSDLLEEAS